MVTNRKNNEDYREEKMIKIKNDYKRLHLIEEKQKIKWKTVIKT